MTSTEQPGYAERDDKPMAEPTGGDPEVLEEHLPGHPPKDAPAGDQAREQDEPDDA
jgi:hypothetical protein